MTKSDHDLAPVVPEGDPMLSRFRAMAKRAAERAVETRFDRCGRCESLDCATAMGCSFRGQTGVEVCEDAGLTPPVCRYSDDAADRERIASRRAARESILREAGVDLAAVRVVLDAVTFPLPDCDDAQRERLRAAGALAEWFARNPAAGRFLILGGETGSGKTCVAAWVMAVCAEPACWLKAGSVSSWAAWDAVADRVQGSRLLVIDDLGEEAAWASEVLGRVLRSRADDFRRTVVTTNLTSAAMFARYGDRLSSRLAAMSATARAGGGAVWMSMTRDVPGAVDLRTGRKP